MFDLPTLNPTTFLAFIAVDENLKCDHSNESSVEQCIPAVLLIRLWMKS